MAGSRATEAPGHGDGLWVKWFVRASRLVVEIAPKVLAE